MGRAFIISNLRDYNFPFLSENKITRMFSIFLMKNGRLSLTYPRMDFFFFLKSENSKTKRTLPYLPLIQMLIQPSLYRLVIVQLWLFGVFFKYFIYLFIFRGGGREGKKHQCVVASCVPPTGDLACNPGMCLTGNQTGEPLVHRQALNPPSHTSRDHSYVI